MSVLVLDIKAYEAVYQKAWTYKFHNQVDINYCQTLKAYETDEGLQSLIKDWLWLNEYSYLRRYREKGKPDMAPFLTFKSSSDTINSYQMLKYLLCIQYNIEISTIKSGYTGMEDEVLIPESVMGSYEVLEKAIQDIQYTIISQLPEYQEAKWDEV